MTTDATAGRIGVIMAGGSGERFWPLSRFHRPKQLLRLTGTGAMLLEEAVERLAPVVPPERILVATGAHLQEAIRTAGLVPPDNVVAEPCKRNTAGCLIHVAAQLLARYGEQARELCLAVTTADHRIGDPERFRQTATAALEMVAAEPVLATIGVAPTRAETGFGYIEVAPGAALQGASTPALPIYPVARFCEKPDHATAESFVRSGRFLWNSGMFFWRLASFLDELEAARPEMAAVIAALVAPLRAGDESGARSVFTQLENTSIDFALMERARRVVVVRGDFPWDDVGSWDALGRFVPTDGHGNVTVGEPLLVDARGCVVYNEPGPEQVAVGVLGVQDLVVVVAPDAVLVMPRGRSQDVREIVARLRERGDPRI